MASMRAPRPPERGPRWQRGGGTCARLQPRRIASEDQARGPTDYCDLSHTSVELPVNFWRISVSERPPTSLTGLTCSPCTTQATNGSVPPTSCQCGLSLRLSRWWPQQPLRCFDASAGGSGERASSRRSGVTDCTHPRIPSDSPFQAWTPGFSPREDSPRPHLGEDHARARRLLGFRLNVMQPPKNVAKGAVLNSHGASTVTSCVA